MSISTGPIARITTTCVNRHMSTAARMRALRTALKLTQTQVADGSGGLLDQPTVAKVESGRNKATSYDVRAGLARAFGISTATLESFLDDHVSIEEVVSQASPPKRSPEPAEVRLERDPEAPAPADDETPLESALLRVHRQQSETYTWAELDLAREVARTTHRYVEEGADIDAIATALLRATKAEIAAEAAPSRAGVLSRWALGKLDAVQKARSDARTAEATASARQAAADAGYGAPEDFPPLAPRKKGKSG